MSNLDKFEEVLRETLRCSKEDLKDENGPNEIVNWDSISHMEMTSKLEEKFDIELDVDEINQIGELVTESMDDDANCIWGARVEEEMKGKLTVMTIVTGVKSPWILGKIDNSEPSAEFKAMNDELGIEIVQ